MYIPIDIECRNDTPNYVSSTEGDTLTKQDKVIKGNIDITSLPHLHTTRPVLSIYLPAIDHGSIDIND